MITIKNIERAWNSKMDISHIYPAMSEKNKRRNGYHRMKLIMKKLLILKLVVNKMCKE